MPTPQCSSTSRRDESCATRCKGSNKIAYPQNAEAVEMLKKLAARNVQAAQEAAMRGCTLAMKPGREWQRAAAKKRKPRPLYRSMWYEGQIAMLFADTNQGKTILATQIAVDLAREGRRVLYCDFEMNEAQFLMRTGREVVGDERELYLSMASRGDALPPGIEISDPGEGGAAVWELYKMPETFYRAEPNGLGGESEKRRDADGVVASDVIRSIEQCAEAARADVVVVDNITYMGQGLEKSAIALQLVQELKQMQKRRGWSMLVLAHTPKRNPTEPLTTKSVAGSAALVGAADSAFAIGCCATDRNRKYIIQVKSRDAAFEYGADNVITCEIEKEDGLFLRLTPTGYAREADLLREPSEKQTAAADEKLAALFADGYTDAQIAEVMGMSKATVWRRRKKWQHKPDPSVFDVLNLDDEEEDDDDDM